MARKITPTMEWARGANEITVRGETYVFDRQNGPFGILHVPGAVRFRVCVKELGPEDYEIVSRVRERAFETVDAMSGADARAVLGASQVSKVGRAIMFIRLICAKGVAPSIGDLQRACKKPPGQWSSKHWLDINTGFAWTGDGHPANRDGSIYKGSGGMVESKRLEVVQRVRETEARLDGRKSIRGLSPAQMEHAERLADSDPKEKRKFLEAEAERLGVTVAELKRWHRAPEFRDKMEDLIQDFVTDPYNQLLMLQELQRQMVEDDDTAAGKLLADMMFKLAPPRTVDPEEDISLVGQMTDEELERLYSDVQPTPREVIHGIHRDAALDGDEEDF